MSDRTLRNYEFIMNREGTVESQIDYLRYKDSIDLFEKGDKNKSIDLFITYPLNNDLHKLAVKHFQEGVLQPNEAVYKALWEKNKISHEIISEEIQRLRNREAIIMYVGTRLEKYNVQLIKDGCFNEKYPVIFCERQNNIIDVLNNEEYNHPPPEEDFNELQEFFGEGTILELGNPNIISHRLTLGVSTPNGENLAFLIDNWMYFLDIPPEGPVSPAAA